MTQTIECVGGTVIKEGEKQWRVYAPDNRPVGLFPTKKQALVKAEHWDKWDALGSLERIMLLTAPFSSTLVIKSMQSIKDGKLQDIPTDEEIKQAVTQDVIFRVLGQLVADGRIKQEDI